MSNSEKSWFSAIMISIKNMPSVLLRNSALLAVIAFLYLLPLGTSAGISPIRTLIYIVTRIMILGVLAMSFDLQLGRAALLNFGHVALFGVSAYFIAFTLDPTILPPPFNLIAAIPYPLTIILAMMIGAGLGLVMGLTTNRMRGTAFAFIALAIAMFIYNFFSQTSDISGGETGLTVPTPDLIRTGPFYLFFVTIAFVVLSAFIGVVILYLKKRTETLGLFLVIPVMITYMAVLMVIGTNILGSVLVFFAFLLMILFFWIERSESISDPLQYTEDHAHNGNRKTNNSLTTKLLAAIIILISLFGLIVALGENIAQMVLLWIEDSSTFYYIIPVQYYLVLTCLVIIYVFIKRLIASPFGRMITAVAQNEERAEALGYNTYFAKIVVLVISGAIAGLAGALYAPFIRTIAPDTALGVNVTINAMLFTIIGGIGTILGPLLGTGVVTYSELNLVDFITYVLQVDGRFWLVGLGILYIIIVLFLPLGIVGSTQRKFNSIKGKLQRLKVRQYEFGFGDTDFWVFGLLGMVGVILLLSEDSRLLPISVGIFGFLGIVGGLILILFRREIWQATKSYVARQISRLISLLRRFLAFLERIMSRFRGGS
ncbi:MAG: branched-chain amino acid ABC transporter permease [Candidatus Thorarchaeota archaeon]